MPDPKFTDELFINALFKNILKTSTVIGGRFFPIKNGAELNETNVGQLVTDTLGGLANIPRKYPCVLSMPPFEAVESYSKGWSMFKMDLFFCTRNGMNGDNTIKSPDNNSQTSTHTEEMDWKDMREIAGNFRMKLRDVIKLPAMHNVLTEATGKTDIMQRFSGLGADQVNGIWLQFYVRLYTKPCTLSDYGDTAVEIPSFVQHPLHTH